jgi:MurNAc alpha-1-phosphate uridylyltransferase
MILAAGRGTRMGSLTENRPKPLLQVGDRAIINHAVARLAGAGVRRLVVNLHHKGEMIRKHLIAACDGSGPELAFSVEDELLETGGGIANALGLLGDAPFYAANGDVIWLDSGEDSLLRLAARFDPAEMDALLLLQPCVNAVGYRGRGDFLMDAAGRLTRRPETGMAPFVFTGVQLLSPALFDDCPAGAFSLNRLYDRAIEAGRLFGLRHEGIWLELNTPEGIAAAEAALAA